MQAHLGMQALDIFRRNNVLVYGILDDHKELHGKEFGDVSVLGATDDAGFINIIGEKCETFVAIGERSVRKQLTEGLNERFKRMPVNAIHDSAIISEMATVGHGNLFAARAVVGANFGSWTVMPYSRRVQLLKLPFKSEIMLRLAQEPLSMTE